MDEIRERYLDLLKKSLTHTLWPEIYKEINLNIKSFKKILLPFYIFLKRKISLFAGN